MPYHPLFQISLNMVKILVVVFAYVFKQLIQRTHLQISVWIFLFGRLGDTLKEATSASIGIDAIITKLAST